MTKKVALSISKKGERSCESCTKCCEGWLTGTIHGEDMYPGKPCHLVEIDKGCSDYENRPEDPCKKFLCMWRANDWIPEEFSPAKTGNIMTSQKIGDIDYLALNYAGKELDVEYLSWFFSFCVAKQLNAEWVVNGKRYMIGTPEFINNLTIRNNTAT